MLFSILPASLDGYKTPAYVGMVHGGHTILDSD